MTYRKEWKWASGRGNRNYIDIPVPRNKTKGRRHLGSQDMTDVPTDIDLRKVMPLPWICGCGNAMLLYAFHCTRCGAVTPLGQENWRR